MTTTRPSAATSIRRHLCPRNGFDPYLYLTPGVAASQIGYAARNNDLVMVYSGAVADWVDTSSPSPATCSSRRQTVSYGFGPGSSALVLRNWFLADSSSTST